MMQIGSVTLDNDMTWEDEFKGVDTAGAADRSIEGGYLTQSYPTYLGQPMTLAGDTNSGWQMRSTVQALKVLAEIPGAQYTVDLNGNTFLVEFRHAEDPVDFNVVTLNPDPAADFWYTGTIRMVIVG